MFKILPIRPMGRPWVHSSSVYGDVLSAGFNVSTAAALMVRDIMFFKLLVCYVLKAKVKELVWHQFSIWHLKDLKFSMSLQ